jgi:hypothetical protein
MKPFSIILAAFTISAIAAPTPENGLPERDLAMFEKLALAQRDEAAPLVPRWGGCGECVQGETICWLCNDSNAECTYYPNIC